MHSDPELVVSTPIEVGQTKRKTGPAFERHYSTAEIGELWNISADFVRDLFRDEPGVVALERTGSRRYVTYRIPESVMLRVHNQMVRRS